MDLVKKRIMIVDDEPDIQESFKQVLGHHGFLTYQASDGRDALSKLRKAKPDLILLDVMMPGITTHDIIKSINKVKRLSSVKIIIITVLKLSDFDRDGILSLPQVIGLLHKPIRKEDLLNNIKDALG